MKLKREQKYASITVKAMENEAEKRTEIRVNYRKKTMENEAEKRTEIRVNYRKSEGERSCKENRNKRRFA